MLAASLPFCGCAETTEVTNELIAGDKAGVFWVESVIDECESACGNVEATTDAAIASIESNLDGFLDWQTESDATSFCITNSLSPGTHEVAVLTASGSKFFGELFVKPFGWRYGIDRSTNEAASLSWIPNVNGLDDAPSFTPSPTGFDSKSVMMPTVATLNGTTHLYYAGTSDEDFQLGHAHRDDKDLPWQRSSKPIFQDDVDETPEWRKYAENTPEALVIENEIWLYYTGRSLSNGGLSIGRATSSDGVQFEEDILNPILEPSAIHGRFDAESVAHPSVIQNGDVFEMWFASGTLEIGYAISDDGRNWEKYCQNPVLSGNMSGWEQGNVKAPEVVLHENRYWMTYSGCGQGCYEVGWATSTDGIRWLKSTTPLLKRTEAPAWNSYGLQAAFIDDSQEPWEIWYTGTGNDSGQIGTLSMDTPPK